MLIRPATHQDFDRILLLNSREQDKTSPLSLERLQQLHQWSAHHTVAVYGGVVQGFLLVMDQSSDYDGDHFRWFTARYSRFLYVDRIVIDASHARRGFAAALYRDLIRAAREAPVPMLCCEINTVPANHASLGFHARLGFEQLAESEPSATGKRVSYQTLDL